MEKKENKKYAVPTVQGKMVKSIASKHSTASKHDYAISKLVTHTENSKRMFAQARSLPTSTKLGRSPLSRVENAKGSSTPSTQLDIRMSQIKL